MTRKVLTGLLFFILWAGYTLFSEVDARMFRYPDVSDSHICFVYANDIWIVSKSGGVAQRLTSPAGEEAFPRFSPDGTQIGFSGNYDGNTDIYTIPVLGGPVTRITHHGGSDRILDWYPRGDKILYASIRESGRLRFNQFYSVSKTGGLSVKLPIPYGEFGMVSPNGRTLAYIPISRDFRTWKRYRGGMAPDIWTFDLTTYESKNITNHAANDTQPMWHGDRLYFLSDRGPQKRHNIWTYDSISNSFSQVTHFKDFDIHFPAVGPREIVFEAGGRLHLLDLKTHATREISIRIVTDDSTRKPGVKNVSKMIASGWPAPDGKRVFLEARGDLFSVPAEKGVVKNVTRSSGTAERFPAWSPDGKWIAYWSDRSGEYQLTIREVDDNKNEIALTKFVSGFGYQPYWSPDSQKIAFVNNRMEIKIFDRKANVLLDVDKGLWMYEFSLTTFQVSWSSDSRWLSYSRGLANRHNAIFLYDTTENKRHQATSGYYSDDQPVFDPDGKYLYFLSNRTFAPNYSDLDNSFIYPNSTNIVAVSLSEAVPSPLAPENDTVEIAKENGEKGESKTSKKKDKKDKSDKAKPVSITLEGFEQRLVVLPPKAGNYFYLEAAPGKIIYAKIPRTGSGNRDNQIVYYDLKEREEKTVISGVDWGYRITADKKKLMVRNKNQFAIIELKPKQTMKKMIPTTGLETTLDPVLEWNQIFTDAWRLVRDYFYDPNTHGVNWQTIRTQYGQLLKDAVTRRDVNFVIGEMIAELNASHTYRGAGDLERAKRRGVGYLGIDWELHQDRYRIKKIIRGAAWDSEVRSPLDEPGIKVKEGDYIIAVNGIELDSKRSPYAPFAGLAGKTVELCVNGSASDEGARKVVVKTLVQRQESRLRHLQWIESNRSYVEKLSRGRVGYIYVRSTGIDGQNELVRQFSAQFHLDGLIVDERFNSGGQIPDRFIELLDRKPLAFWAVRDGKDWPWPPVAHFGPKAMLINGWSGSGGDAFPDYFKKAGLGPLIGKRTWGGLIGMTGAPGLIDGGVVTVPTFRMYDPDGKWFKEGHGVDPDIEVLDDPSQMARGIDPQLKRAVEEVLKRLKTNPPVRPKRPDYEDRS